MVRTPYSMRSKSLIQTVVEAMRDHAHSVGHCGMVRTTHEASAIPDRPRRPWTVSSYYHLVTKYFEPLSLLEGHW